MRKNKKEVSELLLKRIAIVILLVIVISLSFLCAGVIKLNHINHDSIKQFYANRNVFTDTIKKEEPIIIDTSNIEDIITVQVDDTSMRLNDYCIDGCNIKVDSGGIYYYYLIKKEDNNKYILNLVKDNKSIVYKKDLGESVVNLQVLYYAGYLTLYNTYVDNFFVYDYAVSVDSNNKYDEFISLNSNEMEFSSKGVVYYYDLCENDKSYKVKAVRKPFDENSYLVEKIEADFNWC